MSQPENQNTLFSLAADMVNKSGSHIFLTGKAGTGKTTFLRYISKNSPKKKVIVAPTGVAAINAGGVTMHSLFQLPLGSFIPAYDAVDNYVEGLVHNRHTLLKNLRLNEDKRELLRELELIIIDEVSMVRADMLDATDAILRHVRRRDVPFGGVQMLYIGDLFQLPPVIKNEQWDLLKNYYASPFFFDARVIAEAPPVHVELKHIYRQHDDTFVNLLNNVRNNRCTENDLRFLNQYYKPSFSHTPGEKFITLTTHNDKADIINQKELEKLPGKAFVFNAKIDGEFSEKSFPAEEVLTLKEDTQIMFIKNDRGEFPRYYNGKIATVRKIEGDEIWVAFEGENDLLKIERESWQNIRYEYDREKDSITEKELGSFSQFPIRLAWAITIHKSQGLTFTKAIIDAGKAFAPGQVYVALSRLTSLEGLVLLSPVPAGSIKTDARVVNFARNEMATDLLQEIFEKEKLAYTQQSLLNAFSFEKIKNLIESFRNGFQHRELPDKENCITQSRMWLANANAIDEVAVKFLRQIENYFAATAEKGYQPLYARIPAACDFFVKQVEEKLLQPLQLHIEEIKKQKTRKYLKELRQLHHSIEKKKIQLQQINKMAASLQDTNDVSGLAYLLDAMHQPAEEETEAVTETVTDTVVKKKREKGDTQRLTLELYKQGKTIADIAKERQLAFGTIEGHLASFVLTGEIDVFEIVSESKFNKIIELLNEDPDQPSGVIRQKLGEDFSYSQIKAVINYRLKLNEATEGAEPA